MSWGECEWTARDLVDVELADARAWPVTGRADVLIVPPRAPLAVRMLEQEREA